MNDQLADAVKAKAHELGFDLVGITGAEPSAFAAEYREWIDRGCAGEMGYLTRNVERRLDPRELLPGAKSIIVVGMNYYTEPGAEGEGSRAEAQSREGEGSRAKAQSREGEGCHTKTQGHEGEGSRAKAQSRQGEGFSGEVRSRELDADCGAGPHDSENLLGRSDKIENRKSELENPAVFARYALGDDYHDVMAPRLRALLAFLQSEAGEGAEGRVYVDTGPVLEREVARRAGLGWFGKNTMLINTRRGSYIFLGEIVTNVALPSDSPAVGGCGTCTRCIDACPTGAITAPYELDARRCISYLTIELKGAIPEEFHPAIAETGRIYGCDICQEVCPFNRPVATSAHPTLTPTSEPSFQPRRATTGRDLAELALLTVEEFREQFKGSPAKRAKWRGLMRNVAVALSARDDSMAEVDLEHAINHNVGLEAEQPPSSSSVPTG